MTMFGILVFISPANSINFVFIPNSFTPNGDLKTLPKGATALDFAFAIHTDIGLKCMGVKVNGKLVSLSHALSSGNQVEVITSRKQRPRKDWLRFVKTSRAKSKASNTSLT